MAIGPQLGKAADDFQIAAVELEGTERLLGSTPEILNEAALEITPLAQAQLLASFAASGIKSRSGKLASALASAKVSITKKGLRVSIVGSNNLYAQAGALNYGSAVKNIPEREFIKVDQQALRSAFFAAANRKFSGR